MSNKRQKYNQSVPEVIIIGLGKMLWWLISLPFRGLKSARKGKRGLTLEEKNYIVSKRLEIEKKLNLNNELELKHAVLEADKLVDYALKSSGFSGETFADRLRSAEASMSHSLYNSIWDGHKVRNQIAHENELRVTNNGLRQAAEKLLGYLKGL